ncbi:MAG: hypothetical protein EAZ85_11280 [Bacteroidetes bacterium]|nr:MAG: hypothetical protein EAZ85_11280 [Bacteroidota bacterium]
MTMTLGNFGAFRQTDIKRMLAYSSIAHAGFMLIFVVIGISVSADIFFYYIILYSLANFGAFWLAENYYQKFNTFEMKYLAGLGRWNVGFGIIFLVFLLTLNGLPPTAGFNGKLLLFSALWQSYTQTKIFILLILLFFGILNTAFSLFYYLKIPYLLFVKNQPTEEKINIKYHYFINFLFAFALILMFFGINLFF